LEGRNLKSSAAALKDVPSERHDPDKGVTDEASFPPGNVTSTTDLLVSRKPRFAVVTSSGVRWSKRFEKKKQLGGAPRETLRTGNEWVA